MKNIFFTSDTHFGHVRACQYFQGREQFLSPQERAQLAAIRPSDGNWKTSEMKEFKVSREATHRMDDGIIDAINKTVRSGDCLYHLGDWCFAPEQYYKSACAYFRSRIRCKDVRLCWGNHDERSSFPAELFSETFDLKTVEVSLPSATRQRVVLCHYAMASWDQSHRGAWHLYGHSHGEAELSLDQKFPNRRSLDVGIDNAFRLLGELRPFSLDEVRALLEPNAEATTTGGAAA